MMEQLIVDMINKYKFIVSMLAEMNGQKVGNKDEQPESSATSSPTNNRLLTQRSDHSSGNTKGFGNARSNTKLPKIVFLIFQWRGAYRTAKEIKEILPDLLGSRAVEGGNNINELKRRM